MIGKQYSSCETTTIEEANQNLFRLQELHELEVKNLIAKNKKLLAIIGHDVRTPMGSIIGFLANLKKKLYDFDKSKIADYVDIALFSARKSLTLFDNLLEWAFAENAIKSFQQEDVYLKDLLLEEIENIAFFASEKQIAIETNDFLNKSVFVDKNMIRTVLRNLLNNAIKYSHRGGKIGICAKHYNGFAEVSIKDNGIGITQELRNVIFTTNAYNSALGTGNELGSGFGLLLCKEFIDIHKGNIWIVSRPGEGSEFKFTLPLSIM